MTQPVEPPTLDQVLDLVERLPLADQARLVEQVLPRLTHALTAEGAAIETGDQDAPDSAAFAELIQQGAAIETGDQDAPDSAAFAELIQLGQRLARDWPAGIQSADVLSAMRDER